MFKNPLHIAVNARFLSKPYTGIGQYTRHLFWTLAKQNPQIKLLMVTHEAINIDHPANIEIKVLPEHFPGTSGMKKTYWERFQLSDYCEKRKVNIVHHPYPALFSPSAKNQTIIVTVHDDIPWTMRAYQRSFLGRLYQDAVRKKVKQAGKILTVSEASRKDIAQSCHVPIQNIDVIPIAPAPDFYHPSINGEVIANKYNISNTVPYPLYNGGYDVRKNVSRLVKVFAEKIAPFYAINLVMIGGKNVNNQLCDSYDEVIKAQKDLLQKRTKGQIITTGFIPESDIPTLYRQAYLFVNLSLKEGFNLPLLEAAISGTPLLISDIPVHHEVIGEYAAYCSPDDEEIMAQQLVSLLGNSGDWQKYKNKLTHYVCPFSWEQSADRLYKTYESLMEPNL